jgi:LPXTG-motif cell wall-anchored protein
LVNKSNNWYFLIAVATALSLLAVILYRKTGQK